MRAVLDSSALLALLLDEPGADQLNHPTPYWHLSTVNYSEVMSRLLQLGVSASRSTEIIHQTVSEIVPFSEIHANRTAEWREQTKSFGLSLGDRACLALAHGVSLPVYTADRVWRELPLDVEVRVIR